MCTFVERFPDRSLVAMVEPRSNSIRRDVFQEGYGRSFGRAHPVLIPEPPVMEKIPVGERFSSRRLVHDLRGREMEAHYFETTDLLLETL